MPSQCTGSGGKCWTCGPSSLSLDAETPISESQQRKDAAGQLLTRNDASRREGNLHTVPRMQIGGSEGIDLIDVDPRPAAGERRRDCQAAAAAGPLTNEGKAA